MNLVQVHNERVVVSSLEVATNFGKSHNKLLRDIRELECSDGFKLSNYGQSTYISRGKEYPCYLMTRDGFSFLVMGFTGKKAAEWKEKYINAFNQMEKELLNKYNTKKVKSQEWIRDRQESKEARRELTDSIKDYITRHPELSDNAKKFLYSNTSEALNLGIFAKRAKALKEVIGISNNSQLRDYLDTNEVICIKTVEYLACQLIDIKDIYPYDAVKQAIDMSLTHKRFAPKYSTLVKA